MSGDLPDSGLMVLLPVPETAKASAERFTGDAWVDGISGGAGSATLATVRFSPGARTAWHCHPHGQTLHVTGGFGLVQSREGQTIALRPGDTVDTPPGTWHWHGAMPASFMTHLALSDSSGPSEVEWGDHVGDDEYSAAATRGVTAWPPR